MDSAKDILPQRCGRYVLLERLGGGAMAEVYKARLAQSEGPGRVLVVKLLPPDANPHAAARFIDEAKIALPLTHGNITATFEFDRADERQFLVMEYVHGRSLRQVLDTLGQRSETFRVPTALFIGREVSRALRYAHQFVSVDGTSSPVIHRDVSPENILLSFSGQVKLTDFGIARTAGALSLEGAWGKPAYVAPEILAGDPGTPAADLYSLGCVLYEMLSGAPPLLGRSEAETLDLVKAWMPEPLDQLRNDLPAGLNQLLLRMLEKDPFDRNLDSAVLEVTLTGMLAGEAPHFTESNLAATLRHLFRDDQHQSIPPEVLLAQRLRDQLAEAGIVTSGRESASEILQLGTVDLESVKKKMGLVNPHPSPSDGRDSDPDLLEETEETTALVSPPNDPVGLEYAKTTIRALPELHQAFKTRYALIAFVASAAVVSILTLWWLLPLLVHRPRSPVEPPPPEPATPALIAANEPSPRPPAGGPSQPEPTVVPASTGSPPPAQEASADAQEASTLPDSPRLPEPEAPTPAERDTNESRERQRSRRRAPASVTFNSHPWSFVTVDGTKLPGHTPLMDVSLPAGRHEVVFNNPDLGLKRRLTVRLNPGESRFIKIRLSNP